MTTAGKSPVYKLPDEALNVFLREYALTRRPSLSRKAMYKAYPQSEGTPVVSEKELRKVLETDHGQALLEIAREDLKVQIKEYPLAQDFGRIELLCRVTAQLMEMFNGKATISEKVKLSGEIRSYVRELRAETEPFDFEAFKELDAMAALRAQYQHLKSNDKELAKYVEGKIVGVNKSPN